MNYDLDIELGEETVVTINTGKDDLGHYSKIKEMNKEAMKPSTAKEFLWICDNCQQQIQVNEKKYKYAETTEGEVQGLCRGCMRRVTVANNL